MPRLLSFAIFFAVMLTVVGAVHYYLWARLVRDLALPPVWQRSLTVGVITLFVLIPVSFFLRRTGAPASVPLIWVSSVWLGFLLLFLVVLVAGDATRGILYLAQRAREAPPADPER